MQEPEHRKTRGCTLASAIFADIKPRLVNYESLVSLLCHIRIMFSKLKFLNSTFHADHMSISTFSFFDIGEPEESEISFNRHQNLYPHYQKKSAHYRF